MAIEAELHFLTASEQGELIRSREISPVELVRAYLERIDRGDLLALLNLRRTAS